jgi:hypothetical protein
MVRVIPAAWAEFANCELVRLALLVLARGVVAPLARIALKTNQISHCSLPSRES